MMKKPKSFNRNFCFLVCFLMMFACVAASKTETREDLECFEKDDEESIWDSKPIEINNVNIQILDKISGKVFRKNIKINDPIVFGNIKLNLKRCFKNSPENHKEIYAFIEVYENNEKIFAKWRFASSPSVNLFMHAVYDIRIEF